MILGAICTVLGLLGIYGFFSSNIILLVIGAIACVIENIIGVATRQQKDLAVLIAFAVFGGIYAHFAHIPILNGVLLGICFESGILGLFGFFIFIFISRRATKI